MIVYPISSTLGPLSPLLYPSSSSILYSILYPSSSTLAPPLFYVHG